MSEHAIILDIDGFVVEISSPCEVKESFEKIRNDFCSYLQKSDVSNNLKIIIYNYELDSSALEKLKFKKVFRRCETAQDRHIRYNKYDESTYVIFNYAQELAEIYAPCSADQHELCYLIILSRLGKNFDRRGCHRIHAFAGSYKNRAFALSLDMGQGKSTMAFEMLRDEKVMLMSDDAPYFDEQGRLCPFLMRLGISHSTHLEELEKNGKQTYLAKRRNYPDKQLLALTQLDQASIDKTCSTEFVLMFGRRTAGAKVSVKKCSKLRVFCLLFKPMVIGVGLPILAEYFWEFGLRDFFTKTQIALSRIKRATTLATSKECYWFEFGDSLEENVKAVVEVLEQ